MRPYLRRQGLAPKAETLSPCASLLMIPLPQSTLGPWLGAPFSLSPGIRFFAQVPWYLLDSPYNPPSNLERVRADPPPFPASHLPVCSPLHRRELSWLQKVKSTSAAFLWSLVIQRAGWGESTGKKEGGGKATRDILYNSKEQRSL